MRSVVKRVNFDDLKFDICENVYEPSDDTFLFTENLDVKAGDQVLDVGTGCGILAILAAKKASSVIAIDINPYAVHCAKENAILNRVQNTFFIQKDLFSALNQKAKFDLILFNAPYLPSEEKEMDSWIGRSWAGGKTGRQVIDRFIPSSPKHLSSSGRILLLQSTLANVDATFRRFEEYNLKPTIKAERALPFFETISLIEAKHNE